MIVFGALMFLVSMVTLLILKNSYEIVPLWGLPFIFFTMIGLFTFLFGVINPYLENETRGELIR